MVDASDETLADLTLVVRQLGGSVINVALSSRATLTDLRKAVHAKTGIAPATQSFLIDGQELRGENIILADMSLEGNELQITISPFRWIHEPDERVPISNNGELQGLPWGML